MHDLATLAVTFAVCLAATIVVAMLVRIGGKKTSLLNMVAIPVGITLAEALRMEWRMPDAAFLFVLSGLVGLSVFCAQYIKARRSV